jgi:translation initiation factor IF-3
MIGIMSRNEALALAEEKKLDLAEISPNADPPVAKILDFGKYRYDLQKRAKEAKKKQKTMQIKEIRLSTFIEEHDIMVKAKTANKFLKAGDKVKVSLRFRGRERDYVNKGRDVMNSFAEACSENGVVDKKPSFEGRSLTMFLTPKSTDKSNKGGKGKKSKYRNKNNNNSGNNNNANNSDSEKNAGSNAGDQNPENNKNN